MRLYEIPASLLCLIAIISQSTRPVAAGPLLSSEQFPSLQNNSLVERGSCSYGQTACGYYGQLCCNSDQYCYTDGNNQAQCGQLTTTQYQTVAQSTSGQWSMYTTTYVQTDLKTVTTTYSSFYPVTTLKCSYSLGETPCGSCCCQSGQMCQAPGQCVVVAGGSSAYYSSFYTFTTSTQTAIVPLRGTSGSVVTVTSTGSVTTTVPYQTAVGTGGAILTGTVTTTSHGLSGGAIAGIVIGVIAGLILLFLLCACLCFKTLWDGLLSIFGIRRSGRRRTEETYVDRRSSRRQSGGRTWFGTRPGRGSRTSVDVVEKRTSGGWGGFATVGAALAGLALVLGLKRRRDRRREEDKSSVSYDYYSSDYTSASE
jgi:hypothetical protein